MMIRIGHGVGVADWIVFVVELGEVGVSSMTMTISVVAVLIECDRIEFRIHSSGKRYRAK